MLLNSTALTTIAVVITKLKPTITFKITIVIVTTINQNTQQHKIVLSQHWTEESAPFNTALLCLVELHCRLKLPFGTISET